jgi:DNA mismatch repair ATPase MutS
MEQDLQHIFNRIQEKRNKQKELRQAYKDTLSQTPGYKESVEDLKKMREKKKQIELAVRSDFRSELEQLEDLKIDLESDNQILSDLALTKIMKGEPLEIKDTYDNKYEPIFAVRFKRM